MPATLGYTGHVNVSGKVTIAVGIPPVPESSVSNCRNELVTMSVVHNESLAVFESHSVRTNIHGNYAWNKSIVLPEDPSNYHVRIQVRNMVKTAPLDVPSIVDFLIIIQPTGGL